MAARDVIFENGANVKLKFSYRYGLTRTKIEYLRTLDHGESFRYTIRDDGTFEKIVVDYLIISEGREHVKPTNLIISTDTMITISKICVVDSEEGGEAAGTPRQFELKTVARTTTPEAGWIASAGKTVLDSIANVVPGGNSQDIPR